MQHKPFLTIEEQISLLKSRGLTIPDEKKAFDILINENYYRISGYSLTLRKNDKFYKDISFDDILQFYYFDKDLRIFLLSRLENIEVQLRCHIAYELGRLDADEKQTISYFRPEVFVTKEHFELFQKDLSEAHKDSNSEAFVKHHDAKYNGVLPVWAMVETLSFGTLSRMFSGLNVDIKKAISSNYYGGLKGNILDNWFEGLVVLRNMCAHHTRLVNRGIPMSPLFSDKQKEIFLKNDYEPNSIGKRLFFRLLVLSMLSQNPANEIVEIVNEIHSLNKAYPFVDLKHYGFKHNWEDIMFLVIEGRKKE